MATRIFCDGCESVIAEDEPRYSIAIGCANIIHRGQWNSTQLSVNGEYVTVSRMNEDVCESCVKQVLTLLANGKAGK